jgi:PAB-dependent poly(A)-specific ribonuclease subunit 2
MKMVDFVGYATNPGRFLRNQVGHASIKGAAKPKFRSEQEKDRIYGKGDASHHAATHGHQSSMSSAEPPAHYRQVEIEYSKFGVEDFDFGLVVGEIS